MSYTMPLDQAKNIIIIQKMRYRGSNYCNNAKDVFIIEFVATCMTFY